MISVKNLSKTFRDKLPEFTVLRDVNCEISKGEVISIIGPSGTGKSTFLRCINRLETPTSGQIFIDGEDILSPKADLPRLRRKIGMVFQSFNLFNHLSIMQNLCVGPVKLLGMNRTDAEQQGLRLLQMVGLANKADSMPDVLSGGQKQRVAIARCLAMKPEIILFDEPTSALDPTMVHEVLTVMKRLADDGMTMAIVTHEMDFARQVSSRVFFMYDGIVYEDNTPDVIFEHPTRPATQRFINRLRNLDFNIESKDYDFLSMEGQIRAFLANYQVGMPRIIQTLRLVQLLTDRLLPFTGPVDLTIDYSERNKNIYMQVVQHNYSEPILNRDDSANAALAEFHSCCEKITDEQQDDARLLRIKTNVVS